MENLLEIYFENQFKKLSEEYKTQKDNILHTDKFEIARRQCADIIDDLHKELYGVSYYEKHKKVFNWAEGRMLTDETKKTLKTLDEETAKIEDNLKDKIDEIKAQLSMCETYEQKRAILTTYGVIDKKGMLVK